MHFIGPNDANNNYVTIYNLNVDIQRNKWEEKKNRKHH